jgi:hypothetical protein
MFALSLSISFYFLLFDHFMFKKGGGRKVAAAASSEKKRGRNSLSFSSGLPPRACVNT